MIEIIAVCAAMAAVSINNVNAQTQVPLVAVAPVSTAPAGAKVLFGGRQADVAANWYKRRTTNALRLTIILFGLLMGYLILLIMQGALLKLLVRNEILREVFSYLRWGLMIMLVFFAIAYIFKYAPSVKKKWKLKSPGAILATFLSIAASFGFSVFVNSFGKYNALYGSIGTIMMIMALIFLNSLALLMGFELNVSIKSLRLHAIQRKEEEQALKEKVQHT